MGEVSYIGTQRQSAPVNIEAEQLVLGCLLLTQDGLAISGAAGGADLFSDPTHAALYERIVERDKAGMLVSPVALAGWAEAHMSETGGGGYLARMAGASNHTSFTGCVDILGDLTAKRVLIDAMDEARGKIALGEETSGHIAGSLEASLLTLPTSSGPKPVSMMKATTDAMQLAFDAKQGGDAGAVKTGIPSLDEIVGGFYPGELILLGGRPSMGKTSVALSMALNAGRAGKNVAIFSLEMNPESLAMRAISEATTYHGNAVSYSSLRRGDFHEHQIETIKQAARDTAELPIMFLNREFSDLGAMVAGAKQAKRTLGGNLDLLIIDYAQLLRSKARGRYEQITEISIALKALSGQLEVPVLALSQLSRALEQREDKRPVLSDLRESGQLEQDADAVLFCYRDEYYLEREEPEIRDEEAHDAWSGAMERSRNRLELIVAKQRQGQIGTARVMCNPALNKIWEA